MAVSDGVREFWGDFKILFHYLNIFIQIILICIPIIGALLGSVFICIIAPLDMFGYITLVITVPLYYTTAYAIVNNEHLKDWFLNSSFSLFLMERSIVWKEMWYA